MTHVHRICLAFVGAACVAVIGCGAEQSNPRRPVDSGVDTPTGGAGAGGTGGNVAGTGGNVAGAGGNVAGTGGNATGGVGGGTGGLSGTGGTGGSAGMNCSPTGWQCFNCIDDDGDGKVDAEDPECISNIDNDEASFATNIPGDNKDACNQDCFFDGDSGGGNDGCEWKLQCDAANPGGTATVKACPYDPNYNNCEAVVPQSCLDVCRTVTPNGCDCFGCCEVPNGDGGIVTVRLATGCTAATLNDPTKCPLCTQVASCINTCDHCEICVGKDTLPADCVIPPVGGVGGTTTGGTSGTGGLGGAGGVGGTSGAGGTGGIGGVGGTSGAGGTGGIGGVGGTTASPCNNGQYVYCGPGGIDPLQCPSATYCITGCCVPVIP